MFLDFKGILIPDPVFLDFGVKTGVFQIYPAFELDTTSLNWKNNF